MARFPSVCCGWVGKLDNPKPAVLDHSKPKPHEKKSSFSFAPSPIFPPLGKWTGTKWAKNSQKMGSAPICQFVPFFLAVGKFPMHI
jgi:hypothetical protein